MEKAQVGVHGAWRAAQKNRIFTSTCQIGIADLNPQVQYFIYFSIDGDAKYLALPFKMDLQQ